MKTLHLICVTALLAGPAVTFAHGSQPHENPVDAIITVKEQKPWGIAGDAEATRRTITLDMGDDMRFTPAHLSMRLGETARLRAANKGQLMHEIVLGTQASLDEHARLMQRFPTMEHAEPYMAHVAPGQTGELVWNFNRAGSFDFACLIPGHYQAGMRGTITVAP